MTALNLSIRRIRVSNRKVPYILPTVLYRPLDKLAIKVNNEKIEWPVSSVGRAAD